MEGKGYDNKTLTNKAKAWDAIPSKFNSQNTSGIKRGMNQIQGCWKRLKIQTKKEHDNQGRESRKTGGGKAPASPSQVCEVVASVIPASVHPLENEFDDDEESVPNLSGGKDNLVITTCEPGPSGLADVEIIRMKSGKVAESEGSQNQR